MNRVLITGGNKGIGLETTRLFLEAGDEIWVVARDFDSFPMKNHPKVHRVPYDLTNIAGIPAFMKKIGSIDILINNAGMMYSLPYHDYPLEKQERLMALNLYAPIELIRCAVPAMMGQKHGRIVNVASVAGEIGHSDIWYGISKAGLINVTKSFAAQLAPHGIVINAVAPSPVTTDMLDVIPPARREFVKNSVYSHRFAEPIEVAKTIYWLATECPEYINGTCIDINNGTFPR